MLTATTLTTTSWSSAQTHSWFSPHLGGSARGVRSGGDYEDLAMLNCPTVAMSRSRNGSEMNGESYGVTGGTGERCPNVTLLLLRTAESLCRSTFLVRSERRPTSRIVSERRLWVESRRSQTEISMLPNGSAISCRPLTGSDEATKAAARRLAKLACAMAGQLHRLVGRQPVTCRLRDRKGRTQMNEASTADSRDGRLDAGYGHGRIRRVDTPVSEDRHRR